MDLRHLRVAGVACALAALSGAAPAEATFPGRNGVLVLIQDDNTAASRYSQPSASNLRTLNPRTGAERLLGNCRGPGGSISGKPENCLYTSAVTSPDGRRFAFGTLGASYTGGGRYAVYNSFGVHGIAGNGGRTWAVTIPHGLAWSPNGRSLLGVRATSGEEGIYSLSLDGRETGRVVAGHAGSFDVAPNGLIALSRRQGPPCSAFPCLPDEIVVVRAGGEVRRLTLGGGDSPSWSPDGRRLAFHRANSVIGDIYTVRADGSAQRRVTHKGGRDPVWSPDGKRIAFLRANDLLTVKPNGRGLRRVRRQGDCNEANCSVSIADWQAHPRRR